jgi:hypothetical protein
LLFEYFLKISPENLSFINDVKITGTLSKDKYRFLIVSRSALLRMRNVSDSFV